MIDYQLCYFVNQFYKDITISFPKQIFFSLYLCHVQMSEQNNRNFKQTKQLNLIHYEKVILRSCYRCCSSCSL